ncbi:glycosyltransferase [Empedobacter brevis]|uniref:glycosyltransferase n=1 Tax=Empedobacter brevis TaxID=247 RepID=UPI00289FD94C|nr:glycosyltransferase [Empedobacter brevis]
MTQNNKDRKELLLIYYRLFKPGGVTKTMVNLANELINYHNVTILLLIKNHEAYFELDDRVKVISIDTFGHAAFAKGCVFLNSKLGRKIPFRLSLKAYLYDYGSYSVLTKWINEYHQNYDTIIPCLYKLNAYLSSNKRVSNKVVTWEKNSFEGVNKFWQFFTKTFYKNIKGVVTLNNEGKKHYSMFNCNVHKIHNIVGEPYESNLIKLDLKENFITYVGRLSKEKNVDQLIEIYANSKISKDFKLNIVGYGELLPKLIDLTKKINIEDRVVFHGMLKPIEVNKILCKSKIVMLTSSTEGLPNVLVEGMMTGNILVSYDCKYGPSEIINSNNGFLVDVYDKADMIKVLDQLVENQKLMNDLCKSSYNESVNWRKENIVKQWLDIIN